MKIQDGQDDQIVKQESLQSLKKTNPKISTSPKTHVQKYLTSHLLSLSSKALTLSLAYVIIFVSVFSSLPKAAQADDPPGHSVNDVAAPQQPVEFSLSAPLLPNRARELSGRILEGAYASTAAKLQDIKELVYGLNADQLDVYAVNSQTYSRRRGEVTETFRLDEFRQGPFYHAAEDVGAYDFRLNSQGFLEIRYPHDPIDREGVHTVGGRQFVAMGQDGQNVYLIPRTNNAYWDIASPGQSHLVQEIYILKKTDVTLAYRNAPVFFTRVSVSDDNRIPIPSRGSSLQVDVSNGYGVRLKIVELSDSSTQFPDGVASMRSTSQGLYVTRHFESELTISFKAIRTQHLMTQIEILLMMCSSTNDPVALKELLKLLYQLKGGVDGLVRDQAAHVEMRGESLPDRTIDLNLLHSGLASVLGDRADLGVEAAHRNQESRGNSDVRRSRHLVPVAFSNLHNLISAVEERLSERGIHLSSEDRTGDPGDEIARIDTRVFYESRVEEGGVGTVVPTNEVARGTLMGWFASHFKPTFLRVGRNPTVQTIGGLSIVFSMLSAAVIFAKNDIYYKLAVENDGLGLKNLDAALNKSVLAEVGTLTFFCMSFMGIVAVGSNLIYKHRVLWSGHGLSRATYDMMQFFFTYIKRSVVALGSLSVGGSFLSRLREAGRALRRPDDVRAAHRLDALDRLFTQSEHEVELEMERQQRLKAWKEEMIFLEREINRLTHERADDQTSRLTCIERIDALRRNIQVTEQNYRSTYEPAIADSRRSKAEWDYLLFKVMQRTGHNIPQAVLMIRELYKQGGIGSELGDVDQKAVKILSYYDSRNIERQLVSDSEPDDHFLRVSSYSQAYIEAREREIELAEAEAKKLIGGNFWASFKQFSFPTLAEYFPSGSFKNLRPLFFVTLYDLGLSVLICEFAKRGHIAFGEDGSFLGADGRLSVDIQFDFLLQFGAIFFISYALMEKNIEAAALVKGFKKDVVASYNYFRRLLFSFGGSSTIFTQKGRALFGFVFKFTVQLALFRICLGLATGFLGMTFISSDLSPKAALIGLYVCITGFTFTFINQFFIKPFMATIGHRKLGIIEWFIVTSVTGFLTGYAGSAIKTYLITDLNSASPSFKSPVEIWDKLVNDAGLPTITIVLLYFTYPIYRAVFKKIINRWFTPKEVPQTPGC